MLVKEKKMKCRIRETPINFIELLIETTPITQKLKSSSKKQMRPFSWTTLKSRGGNHFVRSFLLQSYFP